jgi:hypothetical protein
MLPTDDAPPADRWRKAADLCGAGLHSLALALGLFTGCGVLGIVVIMVVLGVVSPQILAIAAAGIVIQMPQMLLMMAPICLIGLPLLGLFLHQRGRLAEIAFATLGLIAAHAMEVQPFAKPSFGILAVLLGPILMLLGVIAGVDFVRRLKHYETQTA